MGFWIYMVCMVLLAPLTMIGFGRYFMKTAPEKINSLFGYRTAMSMKSRETWVFAHRYCGKLWFVSGLLLLPISVAVLCFIAGKPVNVIGAAGGILCMVQLIPLAGAIIPTEMALRKNFDAYGRKK